MAIDWIKEHCQTANHLLNGLATVVYKDEKFIITEKENIQEFDTVKEMRKYVRQIIDAKMTK